MKSFSSKLVNLSLLPLLVIALFSFFFVGAVLSTISDNEVVSLDSLTIMGQKAMQGAYQISITKADHLDNRRILLRDISESVKNLDGRWSEEISPGDYVRITFEKNLSSINDITVYPRIISGDPKIEIYEVGGAKKIAEFTSLHPNEYNKVFLTNLKETQDTFDLRVIEGSLQFDHIIDPALIGDYVYNDTNGNGVFDGGDTGLSGIAVRAWNDTNSNGVVDAGEPVTASNTTNATGHYTLNLSNGDYIIQVNYDFSSTLYGFRNTTNLLQPITVSGSNNLTLDFGFNLTSQIGPGNVNSNVKISDGLNGFNPSGLDSEDLFGSSIANIGDFNGDGVQDLAVGARADENDTGGDSEEGAVYILFMYANGSVNSSVKISDGQNGFTPSGLGASDEFGHSIANLGDLDGDGVVDLAVGAMRDENSESREGAIYILFMYANGSVKSDVKISDGLGGFNPSALGVNDGFGSSVANIGDLDGDGIIDLAVGAEDDENSESSEGAIYILFMYANGSVKSDVKISDGLGGFTPSNLDATDLFGSSVANIGDLDNDGVVDLAVGARDDEADSDTEEGAIYILFMYANGSVKSDVKISDGLGGFNPSGLIFSDAFGSSIANIGDLDGDGVTDLVVGAEFDEAGVGSFNAKGAVYVLFMNSNGSVNSNIKIAEGLKGFNPSGLDTGDAFGSSVANMGDLNGDGITDIVVGARLDENGTGGGGGQGVIYILSLNNLVNVVGNLVYNDTNGNGVFDVGDTGLADIAVRAWNDTNGNGVVDAGEPVTASNTTNATGHYTLNLSNGDYIIQVNYDFSSTLYGFRNTTNLLQPVNISGSDNLSIDFGFNVTSQTVPLGYMKRI